MPSLPPVRRRAAVWLPAALAALFVAGLIAGLSVPAAAAPATTPEHSSRGATFGIGPANAKRLDGRPYLTYLTAAGARLRDHVAVVNLDTKRVTLNLYTVDATVGADGKFGYLPRASEHTGAASWLSLATPGGSPTVTVEPRSTLVVPVTIRVPRDAEPGDHAAGVVTSLTSKVTDDHGKQIDFEQRVALRAFFRVSGPLHPQLEIGGLQARYNGSVNPVGRGDVAVSYTVCNTGNVRLGSRQHVEVSGPFARRQPDKALPDVPLLLPDSCVPVRVIVHDVLPQGHLEARVQLRPLTVPGDVDPGLPTAFTKVVGTWAVPWAVAGLVLLLLLAVAGAVLLRRRRRTTPSGRHHGDGPDGTESVVTA